MISARLRESLRSNLPDVYAFTTATRVIRKNPQIIPVALKAARQCTPTASAGARSPFRRTNDCTLAVRMPSAVILQGRLCHGDRFLAAERYGQQRRATSQPAIYMRGRRSRGSWQLLQAEKSLLRGRSAMSAARTAAKMHRSRTTPAETTSTADPMIPKTRVNVELKSARLLVRLFRICIRQASRRRMQQQGSSRK